MDCSLQCHPRLVPTARVSLRRDFRPKSSMVSLIATALHDRNILSASYLALFYHAYLSTYLSLFCVPSPATSVSCLPLSYPSPSLSYFLGFGIAMGSLHVFQLTVFFLSRAAYLC